MEIIYYEKRQLNLSFILVLIVYSVIGIFLLKYYQYQINPDGVSYISIAQKYLNGNFNNAVNGYWGPLISWLLVPFLYFNLNPLLAVKILSLIIGLLTIIGVRHLSYRFEISETIRNAILFALIPIVLYFSLSVITPDLLLTCILIYYLNIIFDADYPDKMQKGAFCGALGAIAYLSKSYAFPFFLSHFFLFNLFHYLRNTTKDKRKKVLQNFFLGLTVFFIIGGSWIAMLSNKYGSITFGTSMNAHLRFIIPQFQDQPERYPDLLKPSDENATSALEEPSYRELPTLKSLNFTQPLNIFKYKLKSILSNSYETILIYRSFSLLSITITLVYVLFFIQPLNRIVSLQSDRLYPFATMMLYSAGYIMAVVEPRYLWINYILLILMGGYLLNLLFQNHFFNDLGKKTALMLFILFFIAVPLRDLIQGVNTGKDIYSLSKILGGQYNIRGNIASNYNRPESLFLSYHLNSRYYIQEMGNTSDKELEIALRKNNIDYYFVWDEPKDGPEFLSKYKEVTDGKIAGLRIYSLRNGTIRKAAGTRLSEETMNETFKKNKPASDIFIDSGNNLGQE